MGGQVTESRRLTPQQRELLMLRMSRAGGPRDAQPRITRQSRPGVPLPLSFPQQRLWFLDQLEPGTGAFNMPAAVRLRGRLDLGSLERALGEVVRRHEALRTVFVTADGQGAQVVKEPAPVRLPVQDISHLGEAARDAEARRLAEEEARRPFDLAAGPLLRTGVVKLGEDEHLILLTMHHIISDGWSKGVLVNEVVTLYAAYSAGRPSPLPELAVQYADYAAWQRQWLRGEALEAHLSYWKQHLQGAPALELPTDRPRPPVQTFQGREEPVQFDAEVAEGLQALSRGAGATLFMTLLAAWQVLLSRYSGQEDICVGSYIANRNRADTEGLIGYFINNLAFRTDLSGNPTFRQLLGRVREVSLDAYLHQDVPFEMVLETLHPERDASRTRLFQAAFVLQNMPASGAETPGMSFSSIETEGTRANFDVTLWAWEGANGLAGTLEYSTDLFDAATIRRMIGHFMTLLRGVVADPDQRIGGLPLLDEEERRRLLVEWNDNDIEAPRDALVHELFEARAAAQPEAVAVVFEETSLTYGALNARANQLARCLQARGVGPETRVGICMERSAEMVVAVLGVLKAGGAYVPLDPAYPQERLAFMMADAQAPLLLTQQRLLQSLPAAAAQALEGREQAGPVRALCLDADAETLARYGEENLPRAVAADNLAYLIYTSGSTRRPRAAMISHGSLANAYAAWERAYSLSTEIRCNLQTASFAFDVFTGDVVRVMCSGGRLVICPGDLLLSAPDFYALLRRERVECVEVVPSVLRNLTQYLEETGQNLDFMRLVVAGADALYVGEFEHARRFCGPRTRLVNTYGLTEATVDTSYFEQAGPGLPAGTLVPIGRPFANTKIYILDRNHQPVPTGVSGELHVGGPSLARGYLNHPALTAEKFVPDPFGAEPGARLYRTGDLARYLPDGNVEFLGRIDYQVKVRGFRIELEEIESVLLMHDGVRQAVVVTHESAPGEKHLVAYVVAQAEGGPPIQALRQLVREHLPAYMVPAAFVTLDAFPLTPNGKVDRRALPPPEAGLIEPSAAYVEPGTEVEGLLAEIWSEVLGRKKIGVLDNFFESGGHSLLATQVVARVRKTFNVELPLRKLFEAPTIAELALAIEEVLLEEIERLNEDEARPLTTS